MTKRFLTHDNHRFTAVYCATRSAIHAPSPSGVDLRRDVYLPEAPRQCWCQAPKNCLYSSEPFPIRPRDGPNENVGTIVLDRGSSLVM
jgi:hypothetical protein